MRFIVMRERIFDDITALKPKDWIVISGVIATIATTPNASVRISPPIAAQAPIARGRIKLEVSGPLATL